MSFCDSEIFKVPKGIKTKWASPENPKALKAAGGMKGGGRKGAPWFVLKSGERYILAEERNTSGTIRRIWMTLSDRSPQALRGLRLEFYWDSALKPAVSVPLGDFFGMGLGCMATFQSYLFSSPEGRSFNCYIPMPFKKSMRVQLINETCIDVEHIYYDIDYTIGEKHDDDICYFHAFYNREISTRLQHDYEILPLITGRGRFLGVNAGVAANSSEYFSSWWGEGECKIYIDGDNEYPSLCGTGTEDYIGTGWGQGAFNQLFHGCTIADSARMRYCFYRQHIPDPVYFSEDIRVTIQQLGCWSPEIKEKFHYNDRQIFAAAKDLKSMDFSKNGATADYGLFERRDDWSSCAYFYLDKPENDLPGIKPVDERIEGLISEGNPFERMDT